MVLSILGQNHASILDLKILSARQSLMFFGRMLFRVLTSDDAAVILALWSISLMVALWFATIIRSAVMTTEEPLSPTTRPGMESAAATCGRMLGAGSGVATRAWTSLRADRAMLARLRGSINLDQRHAVGAAPNAILLLWLRLRLYFMMSGRLDELHKFAQTVFAMSKASDAPALCRAMYAAVSIAGVQSRPAPSTHHSRAVLPRAPPSCAPSLVMSCTRARHLGRTRIARALRVPTLLVACVPYSQRHGTCLLRHVAETSGAQYDMSRARATGLGSGYARCRDLCPLRALA